jgi:hypothetical protein
MDRSATDELRACSRLTSLLPNATSVEAQSTRIPPRSHGTSNTEYDGVYLRRGLRDDVPQIVELQTALFPVRYRRLADAWAVVARQGLVPTPFCRYAKSFYENLFTPRHYIIVACSVDMHEVPIERAVATASIVASP